MALQNLLGELALETKQDDQIEVLAEIESAVQAIASTRGIAGDLRVTIVGGSVATVSTVTNLTQMGGQPLAPMFQAQSNMAAQFSNINNVIIS